MLGREVSSMLAATYHYRQSASPTPGQLLTAADGVNTIIIAVVWHGAGVGGKC